MRILPPLVLALLCACVTGDPSGFEEPRLLSIAPAGQSNSMAQQVIVQLDREPRFFVDYGEKSARMLEQPVLWIGSQQVPLPTYLGHGQFQGTVPAGLDVGLYDVRVSFEDGHETSLADAYEVRAPGLILDFYVETIPTQRTGQPFTITLHAKQLDGKLYEGSAMVGLLQVGKETSEQSRTIPFSKGERQETFTISTPGKYLFVLYDEVKSAYSNSFDVED